MRAWMNSAGHRANILRSSYKNIGIGLSPRYYWTQVFGSPSGGDGCNGGGGGTPKPTRSPTTPRPTPAPPPPSPGCATVPGPEASGVVGRPCVFPFEFRGERYDACTDYTDPDGERWCSVETDASGVHKRGRWGYCGAECPGMPPPPDETPPAPTTRPTTQRPTQRPTPPLPTPGGGGSPAPPKPPADDDKNKNKCTWKLKKADAFCYGDWGVQRKILFAKSQAKAQPEEEGGRVSTISSTTSTTTSGDPTLGA